ncbi:MAG TPA: DALR domain-containing protein, partial [Candidatus Binatus sp.]|nr:DALR domain-containing protein [Candidatus Binatus sp.]
WLHCAHLLVDGQKMSKSLGNFYTLPDVLEKGYTGREIRYTLMRVHYRAPLNFTWEGMEEARQALARIDEWLGRLRETAGDKIDNENVNVKLGQQFEEALDDDLNISAALGFLFESIRKTNRAMDVGELKPAVARAWLDWWSRVNKVLAITRTRRIEIIPFITGWAGDLPNDIKELASARADARLAKDFRKSDELRNELNARGWEVRDTKDGQKLTRRTGA